MGFLSTVKQIWDNFALWIACNKRKFFALMSIAVFGAILGIVMFCNCKQCWWCCNRLNYVRQIVCGKFVSVLLGMLLQTCLVLLLMLVANIRKQFQLLRYMVLFVGSVYVGAHMVCLFCLLGFGAVMYFVFYILPSFAILLCVSLCCGCPTEYCKTVCEVWHECKGNVFVICLLSAVRFLILFLLLRSFSGLF